MASDAVRLDVGVAAARAVYLRGECSTRLALCGYAGALGCNWVRPPFPDSECFAGNEAPRRLCSEKTSQPGRSPPTEYSAEDEKEEEELWVVPWPAADPWCNPIIPMWCFRAMEPRAVPVMTLVRRRWRRCVGIEENNETMSYILPGHYIRGILIPGIPGKRFIFSYNIQATGIQATSQHIL